MEEKEWDYKLEESKIAYQGKRLCVEERIYNKNGKKIYREHVIPGNAVVILPITNNGTVIMIKEARTAVSKYILGLPAGMIEKGEDTRDAAIRELEEETGYYAKKIKKIREYYPTVGYSEEKIEIFLAEDLEKTQMNLDDTEDIEVVEITLEEVKKLLDENKLVSASENIALLYYFLNYNK